jgi:hypothetical protein
MSHSGSPHIPSVPGKTVALEASAGLALGCTYSSSDEFEAEIIRARLAADDEKYRQQRAYCAFIAAAAATIALAYLAG